MVAKGFPRGEGGFTPRDSRGGRIKPPIAEHEGRKAGPKGGLEARGVLKANKGSLAKQVAVAETEDGPPTVAGRDVGEGEAVGDSAPKALANQGGPQVGLKDEEGLGLDAVHKTANVGVEIGRNQCRDHSVGGRIALPALDSTW
jgi:hypothetical protein